MEMIIEESILVANMIQENKRERNAGQEFVPSRMDTSRDAIEYRFIPIEKETLHRNMPCNFTNRKCVMFFIESEVR